MKKKSRTLQTECSKIQEQVHTLSDIGLRSTLARYSTSLTQPERDNRTTNGTRNRLFHSEPSDAPNQPEVCSNHSKRTQSICHLASS